MAYLLLSLIEKPLSMQDEGALVVPPAFAGENRPHWAITDTSVPLTVHSCTPTGEAGSSEPPVWNTGRAFHLAQIIQSQSGMSRERENKI
ncbi:MAG: hypothetical protein GYA52_08180 [Chloroflexi bacterium]|jgi:hypothetical protein|nr:hypothetical protein [Chloroflexota bacterium]